MHHLYSKHCSTNRQTQMPFIKFIQDSTFEYLEMMNSYVPFTLKQRESPGETLNYESKQLSICQYTDINDCVQLH